jgi:hypothetical protein
MFEPATGEAGGYYCRGPGYQVRMSPGELTFVLQPAGSRETIPGAGRRFARDLESLHPVPAILRLRFLGADPHATPILADPLPTRVNYFHGQDPATWRTNLPTYGRVGYAGVYPGVDLLFYGNQRLLEHDFVLAPGADPGAIALGIEGVDRVELAGDGDLLLWFGAAPVRLKAPVAFQAGVAERRPVAVAYRLEPGRPARVTFDVGAYDRTQPLVIDPVLLYSTFLGGVGYELANGIAVDGPGAVYLTGETSSTNFPTANPLWPTNAGGYAGSGNVYGNEAFIVKLAPGGSNLVYATYLGGSAVDGGIGIALDTQGRVHVTGYTASTNFPVSPNALSTRLAGVPNWGFYPNDAFVLQLSADGAQLLYSTYVGGAFNDLGLSVALGSGGAVHVAGSTESPDFPATAGSRPFAGGVDAFVLKLEMMATAPVYATFLGGSGSEFGQSLAVDALGRATVVGQTVSTDFPLVNAIQTNYQGGVYDAFVTRLGVDGRGLDYSTYLGGAGQDEAYGVALDTNGHAWVTGFTDSGNFPTNNGLTTTPVGLRDVFLTRFTPAGALGYSTYLGGTGNDEGWALAIDPAGSVHVTGMVASPDFPTTNALQTVLLGGRDVFVTRFRPDAGGLDYSTYLGGSQSEEGRGVGLDAQGNAYVTGYSSSPDFPMVSTNVLQYRYGGGGADAFVIALNRATAALAITTGPPGGVTLSWPAVLTQFAAQVSTNVAQTNAWSNLTTLPTTVGGTNVVTLTNLAAGEYFRLRRTN